MTHQFLQYIHDPTGIYISKYPLPPLKANYGPPNHKSINKVTDTHYCMPGEKKYFKVTRSR